MTTSPPNAASFWKNARSAPIPAPGRCSTNSFARRSILRIPIASPSAAGGRDRELGREDVFSFYHDYYSPDNAILIVAGDVTPDEVRALAEEHMARWNPRAWSRASAPRSAADRGPAYLLRRPRVFRSLCGPQLYRAGTRCGRPAHRCRTDAAVKRAGRVRCHCRAAPRAASGGGPVRLCLCQLFRHKSG